VVHISIFIAVHPASSATPREGFVVAVLDSAEGVAGGIDPDAVGLAYELVVAGLIGVLGPAPSADVADEDGLEVRSSLDVLDETLEGVALLDPLAGGAVAVGPDDFVARGGGV
jgi:hypothetical protein